MLPLIVLWTLVCLDFEVLLAKGQFTMLALEWEEIDEKTRLMRALLSNFKELRVRLRKGGRGH